jgi:serine/threonine protein phosphatase PrpC
MIDPKFTPPSVRLKWSGWTDRGKIRPNNEDAFLGLLFDSREVHHLGRVGESSTQNSDCVFAVSDGMGGARAGEFASRIAVETITKLLPRSFRQSAIGLEAGYAEVLKELYDQINRSLTFVGASYEECFGMGATLSLCWFTPGWMYFGHIGDTRIYYLSAQRGGIQQLSHDDTHVGWLYRQGHINEREARTHPRRNILQKALGGGSQFVEPQVGAVAYEPGDIFLLCTDGLIEGLLDRHLIEILRPREDSAPLANSAQILVNEAVEKHGRDNTTALVIQAL